MISEQFIASLGDRCVSSDEDLDLTILSGIHQRIQTVNLHHLALAAESREFAKVVSSAGAVTADGWPVVLLLRAKGFSVSRVTGSELLERIVTDSRFVKLRLGLLGASEHSGDRWQDLVVSAGMSNAFREHGHRETWRASEIVKELHDSEVQLLLIAVTPPFGDQFGASLRAEGFEGVVINIGGAIDMMVGARKMAPQWARRWGVEWAYRMLQDPRRLWRRYILECVPILVLCVFPAWSGSVRRRLLFKRDRK